jgi:hypothetical protein
VARPIPTPEEVVQLTAVADERFQPFIALCAIAGLRLRETAEGGLATTNSSADRSRSPVRFSASTAGRSTYAPKYGSERVVYLADSPIDVLAEQLTAQATTGKARWIFAGEGDDPSAPKQNRLLVAQDAAWPTAL